MKIIGITGRKRAGKDTVADILNDGTFKTVSFADPMRDIMNEICNTQIGYDYETHKEEEVLSLIEDTTFATPTVVKLLSYASFEISEIEEKGILFNSFLEQFKDRNFSPREFLQKLGTEFAREHIHEDVWVEMLFLKLEEEEGNYIIPDVRFENEAKAIREIEGGIIIEVIRENHPDGPVKDTHKSEEGVELFVGDYSIRAETLEELEKRTAVTKRDLWTDE